MVLPSCLTDKWGGGCIRRRTITRITIQTTAQGLGAEQPRDYSPPRPMPLIRPSTEADLPAVTAIYGHHVLNGTGTFETTPPSESDMAA